MRILWFSTLLCLPIATFGQAPGDFHAKFERPYAPLLDAGVQGFAVLGNHDLPLQQSYAAFHMSGRNYYSFQPLPTSASSGSSNRMDQAQLNWLEAELTRAHDEWKVVFFHHPIYSSGARHGSDLALRNALEPLFVNHGVTLALAGHDHFYERIKPQHGVHYFSPPAPPNCGPAMSERAASRPRPLIPTSPSS
jgi:hypothetical protein